MENLSEHGDLQKELAQLRAECAQLRAENADLKNQPGITPTPQTTHFQLKNSKAILSAEQKIALFRRLFRGREDVYALRWQNKQGRSGYSPACGNEWHRTLCRKPKIKCHECSNSKWLPVTNAVIYDHLVGKHMIGVYPLRQDETCYFLAIDFDKTHWQRDVLAFSQTCRCFSVPVLLERSQSGNGAHVWIFFADSIPAALARNLGTALLTQTMREHAGLSLDSYDRLFPNQDTLPKGGFGNLIALPLQGERRKQGNSTFMDDGFQTIADPWPLLSNIQPMSYEGILTAIERLTREGNALDVRHTDPESVTQDPWVTASETSKYPKITQPLPQTIEIVKANLLYVPTQSLPPVLIDHIKKLAAFQNPEFYKAQAMRLSTYGKPRVISCAEIFDTYLGLPRGCEQELLALFSHYGIQTQLKDEMQSGQSVRLKFLGKLTTRQNQALKALLTHDTGVLAAATGFGKTVIAAKLIAERKTNTLILVHRHQLLEQWRTQLSAFL